MASRALLPRTGGVRKTSPQCGRSDGRTDGPRASGDCDACLPAYLPAGCFGAVQIRTRPMQKAEKSRCGRLEGEKSFVVKAGFLFCFAASAAAAFSLFLKTTYGLAVLAPCELRELVKGRRRAHVRPSIHYTPILLRQNERTNEGTFPRSLLFLQSIPELARRRFVPISSLSRPFLLRSSVCPIYVLVW